MIKISANKPPSIQNAGFRSEWSLRPELCEETFNTLKGRPSVV